MRFDYTLVQPHLAHLDEAQGDTLVIYFYEDERPLKGLAGLIDWRMNGKLTSFLTANRMQGNFKECTLYPVRDRIHFQKILCIGLGERLTFNGGKFQIITSFTMDTLKKLGINQFALAFPRKPHLKISIRQIMEIWMTECRLRLLSGRNAELAVSFFIHKEDQLPAAEFINNYLRQYIRSH